MSNSDSLSISGLENMRDLGAATYTTAFIRLMSHRLGVRIHEEADPEVIEMAVEMVEPLNHATEATWRAMMGDVEGCETSLAQFRLHLIRLCTQDDSKDTST